MDAGVGGRAQMPVDRDAAIGVLDLARGEIQRIDIGDASRAVDDAFGLGRMLGALVGEVNAPSALMTSTLRLAIERPRLVGMSLIMSFLRSISAAQSSFGLPTAM